MGCGKLLVALLILFAFCTNEIRSDMSKLEAEQYLQQFGYTNNMRRRGNSGSGQNLAEGVKTFQRFAGLEQTGVLDKQTLEQMQQPRCGVPDVIGTTAARKKRYALQGTRWTKKRLTYKIVNFTPDMRKKMTAKKIAAAFKVWEAKSGLKFKRVYSPAKADIDIKFVVRDHGDGAPFDGKGGTLAHAFFPKWGGDAHFDDDETWSKNSSKGVISLFNIAVHEFGHSLGLLHSDVKSAAMWPFYNRHFKKLDIDDIRAIKRLYPKRIKNNPSTSSETLDRSGGNPPEKQPELPDVLESQESSWNVG